MVVIRDPRDLLAVKAGYALFLGSDEYARAEAIDRREGERSGYRISRSSAELIDSLQRAQNFWVAEDMVVLLEAAQGSMPDDGVLLGEPPAPHGFLILAKPIRLPDRHQYGVVVKVNALHWRTSHRAVPASKFAPAQEDEGILLQWFCDSPDPLEQKAYGSYPPFGGGTFLPENLVLQLTADADMGALDKTSMELSRRARAMWVLMQQQLASTTKIEGSRKQQEKARKARTSSSVSIVTLRRKSAPTSSGGGVHVEYSHRWVVRGHWRNQWHPGLQAHRSVWITDHVKGPIDTPLIVKDKINLWKR